VIQDPLGRQRFANIDRRLALAFGGLILVLMMIVLFAGGRYLRGVMETEQDRLATLTTRVLTNAVSRVSFSGKYQARLLLEEIKSQQPDILYIRLIDSAGVVIAHSDPEKNDQVLERRDMGEVNAVLTNENELVVRNLTYGGEPVREVSAAYRGGYDNATVGVIQVGISESIREKALRDGVILMALLLLTLLAVGIGVTFVISKHFGSPVRRMAIQMERERTFLQALIGTIPDLVWLKDPNGMYLACNPAFERLVGKTEDEIVGRYDHDFFGQEEAANFKRYDADAVAAGKPTSYQEWVVFASDGANVLLETTKTPLVAPDGSLVGVLGLGHDITEHRLIQDELTLHRDRLEDLVRERTSELESAKTCAELATAETQQALEHLRRTQEELLRSEKIAALGSMVAGVAHELNTPIGNALTVATTIRDSQMEMKKLLDERLTRSTLTSFLDAVGSGADILERNLHRAAELVTNFKQLAVDQSSHQRRRFALQEVIDEVGIVMTPALRKAGVRLHCQIPGEIQLDSYPGPLSQGIMILISNTLVHAFSDAEPGNIDIAARQTDAQNVIITFRDDGAGIAPKDMNRVFEPFYTTKFGKGGSGLGLHILYNIVTEVLGGRVIVESSVNEGTTFTLTIPLVPASSASNQFEV